MGDYAQRQRDSVILLQMEEVTIPTAYDRVILGALLMRYQINGDPSDTSFLDRIDSVLNCWHLSRQVLYNSCRQIWADGFRPPNFFESGSSWDSLGSTNE